MPTYKLTYFDFDGGRAEPVRIAFHSAGIDFEDNRLSFAEFNHSNPKFRFHSVPILEIDGEQITQSNAMCRYIGRMAGLYPEDNIQALYCDETLDALEDISHYIVQTFFLEGEALRSAREKLVDGWLTIFIKGLDELLRRGGGTYFADNRLTMADLKVFVQVRALCSGILDHVPTDLVSRLAPDLIEHEKRISEDPRILAYYAGRSDCA